MKLIVACVALVLIMQISASPVVITSDVKELLSTEIADPVPEDVPNDLESSITTTEQLDVAASLLEVKRSKKSHEAAENFVAAVPPGPHCSDCTSETDQFSSASFPAHHAIPDHHALQMAHIEAAKHSSQQQFRDNAGYGFGSHPYSYSGHHDGSSGSHQPSDYHGSGYQGAGYNHGYHGGHQEAVAYQPSYQPSYQAPAFHAPAYPQTYQSHAYSQSYQAPAYQPSYQAQAYQPAYPAPAYPPTYEIYNGPYGAPQPYPAPVPQSPCGSNLMIRCSPQVQYTSCGGGDGGYGAPPYSDFSYVAPAPAPAYRNANADNIEMKSPKSDSDGKSKNGNETTATTNDDSTTDKIAATEPTKTAKAKSTEGDSSTEQRSTLESSVSKQQETQAQPQAQSQQQSHLDDASEKQKATMMKMAQMAQKMENNKNQQMVPMPTQHHQQQAMIAGPQMQGFMPGPGSNQQYFQPNAFKQR